jgi:hypothetical protein
VFAAGAFFGPAINDVYEALREGVQGRSIASTDVRQMNVIDYNGDLRTDYDVERTVSGQCSIESEKVSAPGAYRCSFGQELADPCLALGDGSAVVCLSDPWTRTVTRVDLETLVSREPSRVADRERAPWALEVIDPRDRRAKWRCISSDGNAASEVSGNRSNWSCHRPDGSGTAYALNDVAVNTDGPWKVLLADDGSDLVEADIAIAWF